jgi:hypothetical protein
MRGPFRSGPWPGLTGQGALVLLGCAALLALGEVVFGLPREPLWDVPRLAGVTVLPLLLATLVVRLPGGAAAVCGAYLLPRSLLSLVVPTLEPPPLLLAPALVLDLTAWLRRTDFAAVRDVFPRKKPRWRRLDRTRQPLTVRRLGIAGASFGVGLGLLTPPWQRFLGAPEEVWTGPAAWASVVAAGAVAGGLGAGAAWLSARGTGSRSPAVPTPPPR